MVVHRIIGLLALVAYVYMWVIRKEPFPSLAIFELTLLPLFGIACLTIPKTLTKQFSAKTPIWNTPTLTPGFYVVVGYFSLLVSTGLWWILR
jgi:hypothetical protein